MGQLAIGFIGEKLLKGVDRVRSGFILNHCSLPYFVDRSGADRIMAAKHVVVLQVSPAMQGTENLFRALTKLRGMKVPVVCATSNANEGLQEGIRGFGAQIVSGKLDLAQNPNGSFDPSGLLAVLRETCFTMKERPQPKPEDYPKIRFTMADDKFKHSRVWGASGAADLMPAQMRYISLLSGGDFWGEERLQSETSGDMTLLSASGIVATHISYIRRAFEEAGVAPDIDTYYRIGRRWRARTTFEIGNG